jgi:ethanolamine transporter
MILVLKNLIPVVVITLIIALTLYLFPFATLHGFMHFSKAVVFLMTFGAILAIFQFLTHIKFPLWRTMIDDDGENLLVSILETIGRIAMMLTGILPMVHFIIENTRPVLSRIGNRSGLSVVDVSGMLSDLATAFPMYAMFGEMSEKGMVINAAFGVGASWALGDHLSYLGSVQSDMVVPMIIGKLTAGFVSLVICFFFAGFFVEKGRQAAEIARDSESQSDEVVAA